VIPEIISGFACCYPKFPNKIRVSGISGSGSGIPGSGFGLRVFCPALRGTLVTPYCKRTRPGRGTNTKAAGFPPLSRRLPPFALGLAPTHLGWGTRRHLHSSAQGPPGLETPTKMNLDTHIKLIHQVLYKPSN
jgi:hypothetical protein